MSAHSTENGVMHDVIIIGGGVSALTAAQYLKTHSLNYKVLVLEASSRLGGRVKSVEGIGPWPIELGAEFIHGKNNNSVIQIAEELGCNFRELPFPDRYYFHDKKTLIHGAEAENNEELEMIHSAFSNLSNEISLVEDISMVEYLTKKGFNQSQIAFSDSIFANDFGCSLSNLGLNECIEEAKNWNYGDTYLILDKPLQCLVDKLSKNVNVKLNCPVVSIDYSNLKKIRVEEKKGKIFFSKHVIISVPITILKDKDIEFFPPLPAYKIHAINSIGMSSAIKVVLCFTHKFFQEDIFDIVCANCFLPEIWFTNYPPNPLFSKITLPNLSNRIKSNEDSKDFAKPSFCAIGFVAGDKAISMSKLTHEQIISKMLAQLDEIFYKNSPNNSNLDENLNPKSFPATDSFVHGCVYDWSKEPFIRGAYSYPSLNAYQAREDLASPVERSLFFCGEATHHGVNPCLQAAMDTGTRVAKEVLNSFSSRM